METDIKNTCTPKPQLTDRPLLEGEEAEGLSDTFKILANATRLRILHALVRNPNTSVTELSEQVGMKPQAISNQLQRLVDKGVVRPLREGNFIHYQIVDTCVIILLDRGWCLTEDLPN
ncbi:ArsR/SmtB family transcription factor [Natribacillus halophilus]|uniref:DNA-binding transcriptional regulator, ArsR family n=1 Tax=Natribacillus halophilus TaxID=549003 RepID=A0A1G8RDJ9_9BACI|nr:metalloregulator ArsR/SmtB family transcription factor [Natribacillus halophilus]SDJ15038.1 DNA-binding transcriptional regulator, ArsR family [Natribacillus halophilus]